MGHLVLRQKAHFLINETANQLSEQPCGRHKDTDDRKHLAKCFQVIRADTKHNLEVLNPEQNHKNAERNKDRMEGLDRVDDLDGRRVKTKLSDLIHNEIHSQTQRRENNEKQREEERPLGTAASRVVVPDVDRLTLYRIEEYRDERVTRTLHTQTTSNTKRE